MILLVFPFIISAGNYMHKGTYVEVTYRVYDYYGDSIIKDQNHLQNVCEKVYIKQDCLNTFIPLKVLSDSIIGMYVTYTDDELSVRSFYSPIVPKLYFSKYLDDSSGYMTLLTSIDSVSKEISFNVEERAALDELEFLDDLEPRKIDFNILSNMDSQFCFKHENQYIIDTILKNTKIKNVSKGFSFIWGHSNKSINNSAVELFCFEDSIVSKANVLIESPSSQYTKVTTAIFKIPSLEKSDLQTILQKYMNKTVGLHTYDSYFIFMKIIDVKHIGHNLHIILEAELTESDKRLLKIVSAVGPFPYRFKLVDDKEFNGNPPLHTWDLIRLKLKELNYTIRIANILGE